MIAGHLSWQGIAGIVAGTIGVALSVFTAGASIAAAGGVMAALGAASATSLVVGGLGVAADVTAIASGAVEESNPQASSILGWVSMATGLAGIVEGMGRLGMKELARATAETRQRLGNILHTGLSGRGAPVAARAWEAERVAQYADVSNLMEDIGQWTDIHMSSRYDIQRPVSRNRIYEVRIVDSKRHSLINIKTGESHIPNGHYIFVNRSDSPGKIYAMREHSSVMGHTSLAQKGGSALPVRYAGVLTYREGRMLRWTNNSGHYQPNSALAHSNLIPWVRRILPINKFEPFNA